MLGPSRTTPALTTTATTMMMSTISSNSSPATAPMPEMGMAADMDLKPTDEERFDDPDYNSMKDGLAIKQATASFSGRRRWVS